MTMSELVVGPRRLLDEALAGNIESARAEDPLRAVHVVVPSNLLATALSRRLAQSSLDGLFNVRFLTFIELARMLAGPDETGRPLSSRLNLLAAIRHAGSRSGDSYFGELTDHLGLHEGLLATLLEIENASLAVGDLERHARRLGQSGPSRQGDAQRVLAVAETYKEAIQRLRRSREPVSDLFRRAEVAAGQSHMGMVLAYGFHDFTELQVAVLASLARGPGVRVFLADENVGSTPYMVNTIDRLEKAGFETTRLDRGTHPHEKLAAGLFKQRASSIEDAFVTFTSAPGQVAEVEDVVRRILALFAAGLSPDDVAIAYRGEEPYPRLLAETLQRAGLKYFLAQGTKLADTRQGKSILLLLSLATSNLGRREVMDFLSFAALKAEVLAGANAENWEALSRRAAVVSGRDQWESRLGAYLDVLDGQAKHYPDRAAALSKRQADVVRFLAVLRPFFERLSTAPLLATWADHVEWLTDFTSDYLEDQEGAEAVAAALRQICGLGGDEATPFADFQRMVRLHFEQTYARHGSIGKGHIFVGQPRDFRGLDFETVFIVGLAERSFPQPLRTDALLPDSDRRQLAADTGRHLSLSGHGLDEERLLFAGLVASARNLHLSFPRFDEKKPRPRYPSPFFLAAAEALHGRRFDFKLGGLDHRRLSDVQPDPGIKPEASLAVNDYDVALLASSGNLTRSHVAYMEAVAPHFRSLRTASWARNVSSELTRYDGLLQDEDARTELRATLAGSVLSATALEQYAECPQRFFLDHALHLEALDEPESATELSPLDRGVILHTILENFYRTLSERQLLPLQQDRQSEYSQLLAAAAEREFQSAEERGVTGMLVGWKANRRVLLEELSRFLYQEIEEAPDSPTPFAFEYNFGDSPANPPLVLEPVAGLQLRFRGKIDRIDRGDRCARVLDYKSGKTQAATLKDGQVSFNGGRQLQLPIYSLAAARDFGLAADEVDAAYIHINREAGFAVRPLAGSSFAARRRDFDSILGLIAQSMIDGIFVPRTLKGSSCRNCDFRFVCPARVKFQEERKADRESQRHLQKLNILRDIK